MAACVRRAWLVATLGLALGAAAITYAATHFAMTTDTDQLLSRKLPYLKRDAAFNRLFHPEGDRLVIVVDGVTPELSEGAATALAARLAQRPDLFHDVYRPDADPFFQHNGLLFRVDTRGPRVARPADQGAAFPGSAGGRSEPARPDDHPFDDLAGCHYRSGDACRP